MANIFPLVSEVDEATLTLDNGGATATTHDFTPASRTVLINAAGADEAATHTVNLTGPNGFVFFIDVTSLNKDSDDAASSVIFKKGGNTLTIDAAAEAACVMLTDNGFQDASDLLLIGATSGATFA